jgi:hypothetical protein
MLHIMTINLAMRTRFVGVKVSGNGLKRIKEIFVPMKPTTFLTPILPPIAQQDMMWKHLVLT